MIWKLKRACYGDHFFLSLSRMNATERAPDNALLCTIPGGPCQKYTMFLAQL